LQSPFEGHVSEEQVGGELLMIDLKERWTSVTDRGKWTARGASFVAKAKATKVVWFPPKPAETGKQTGKKAAATAKKTTKKTSAAAKKVNSTK
jgi:hypothetical protein